MLITDYCVKSKSDYSPVPCHTSHPQPQVEVHHHVGSLPEVGGPELVWLWVAVALMLAGVAITVWTMRRNNINMGPLPEDVEFHEAAIRAGKQRRT